MTVVYEDNHIIVVNKTASEIVQADKTGDMPLSETVKQYLKEKYQKPGNVFLGVTHRLDRPVSGLVIFAKTSKALTRLNEMFRAGEVKKTYWAVVKNAPKESEGELVHFLVRNEKQNKSYAYDKEVPNSKKAVLDYRLIGRSENYYLLEVDLKTGLSVGGGSEDRAASSDTMPAGKDGMSYQGRLEVWLCPFQSGWKYLSARQEGTVRTPCLEGADRTESSPSRGKFMERI